MRFFMKPSGLAILTLLCMLAGTVPLARGDFLFVISSGGVIEELDSSGTVIKSDIATVSGAESLAFNANGNLFVGSSSGNIYEVSPSSGKVTTFISGSFGSPVLAFNANGDLFVGASNNTGTIEELSSQGSVINSSFATGLGAISALAFNAAGDLFVTNGSSVPPPIYEVTPSGSVSTFATASSGLGAGLAFNASGELYYATYEGYIYSVKPNSTTYLANIPANTAPGDALAVNSSGDLFVSSGNVDSGGTVTQFVYEVTPSGSVKQFANVPGAAGLAFQPAIAFVPAPSSLTLLSLGLCGLAGYTWRGRRYLSFP